MDVSLKISLTGALFIALGVFMGPLDGRVMFPKGWPFVCGAFVLFGTLAALGGALAHIWI